MDWLIGTGIFIGIALIIGACWVMAGALALR